jgi:hypothetical protein
MRLRSGALLVLLALGLVACGSTDKREWMKVGQKYTKEEFLRDRKECLRDGDPDEACMRQRGWVPVSPSSAEKDPPKDPIPRSRGRY